MEDRSYFREVCLCRLISGLMFQFLSGSKTPGTRDLWQSSFLRNSCSYSDKGSSEKASFYTSYYPMTSTPDNPQAKVTYFGMAFSNFFQLSHVAKAIVFC